LASRKVSSRLLPVRAREGGKTVFERSWDNTIARDCM